MPPNRFVLPQVTTRLWTSSDLRRLREMAEAGADIVTIATALRRSTAAIRNKAVIHGITVPRTAAASLSEG